jgi:hypothetical protein
MRKTFLIAVAVTVATPSAYAFDIKGMKIGNTLSAAEALHPGFTKCADLKPQEATKICMYRNTPEQVPPVVVVPSLQTYASQPTRYVAVHHHNEVIKSVSVAVDEKYYAAIRDALDEKLGKPKSRTVGSIKNRAGVSFDQETTIWAADGDVLILRRRSGSVDQSSILLTSEANIASQKTKAKERSKTNAKDL